MEEWIHAFFTTVAGECNNVTGLIATLWTLVTLLCDVSHHCPSLHTPALGIVNAFYTHRVRCERIILKWMFEKWDGRA